MKNAFYGAPLQYFVEQLYFFGVKKYINRGKVQSLFPLELDLLVQHGEYLISFLKLSKEPIFYRYNQNPVKHVGP